MKQTNKQTQKSFTVFFQTFFNDRLLWKYLQIQNQIQVSDISALNFFLIIFLHLWICFVNHVSGSVLWAAILYVYRICSEVFLRTTPLGGSPSSQWTKRGKSESCEFSVPLSVCGCFLHLLIHPHEGLCNDQCDTVIESTE